MAFGGRKEDDANMTDKQIMIIAFIDAWYIIDAKNMDVLQGPFETHADAEEAVKTRAWRTRTPTFINQQNGKDQ